MAYLKCNYVHLHFSDNNGFRIQSDHHPEIVSAEHLTKRQVRDLVALAARYFITIIPEIDMPGHLGAALSAHPGLRLKNVAGAQTLPYAGDLDVTSPAARHFARELVEEFLPLFPGPYWHMGGDEYMPSAELALFPQLTSYARANHGPNANAGDAVLDFYNEMNSVVRAHHKTTRMWHDELNIGSAVRVDRDITVEWWTDRNPLSDMSPPSPQALLDSGHAIMNCGWFPTYYDTGATGQYVTPRADMGRAYEQWEPHQFAGAFFSPTVAGQSVALPPATIAPNEPRNLGAKIHIWTADNEPEATTTAGIYTWLRVLAQKTWGTERLTNTYSAFQPIIAAIGRAPGWHLG
jgi:hexosaminidase